MTAASAFTSLSTPVEVSVCWRKTAFSPGLLFSVLRRTSGSIARPHSKGRISGASPKALWMATKRSPKTPVVQTSVASPGERRLMTADSIAPVPELVIISTEPLVR